MRTDASCWSRAGPSAREACPYRAPLPHRFAGYGAAESCPAPVIRDSRRLASELSSGASLDDHDRASKGADDRARRRAGTFGVGLRRAALPGPKPMRPRDGHRPARVSAKGVDHRWSTM